MKEICGDEKLNSKDQFLYLFFNFFRGIFGLRTFGRSVNWHPKDVDLTHDSPGRAFIDRFFMEKLPEILTNKKISICDLGCGSGYIREIFSKAGYSGNYFGVDKIKNPLFDKLNNDRFKSVMMVSDAQSYNIEEKYDLLITYTSLEHMKDDEKALNNGRLNLKNRGVEIHVVPSFWSLFIYLFHGYRQYNGKKITDLFKGKDFLVYKIGGLFSFLLHLFFITIPERLTGKKTLRNTKIYPILLRISNSLDKMIPIFQYFYIIVAKS